jgi:hypothetical protein
VFSVCLWDGAGYMRVALAQYNGSVRSFGSFHAMHEPVGQGNAGVCTGHGNSWELPEASERAQTCSCPYACVNVCLAAVAVREAPGINIY